MKAGMSIEADKRIESGNNIIAGGPIEAGGSIEAGESIYMRKIKTKNLKIIHGLRWSINILILILKLDVTCIQEMNGRIWLKINLGVWGWGALREYL